VVLSGLAGSTGPNGAPLITNTDQYAATLAKADEIFKEEVLKVAIDKPVPPADAERMREACKMYDSLSLFIPTRMGPYFASGRLHLMLGESEIAAREFRQAIDNDNQPTGDTAAAAKQLKADSYYYLGVAYLNFNDFKDALDPLSKAIDLYGDRGDYRYARARVYIQLNRLPEAKRDLVVALQLDPTDEKAIGLFKFVDSASK
jgi:tetratricopeptide (TPR) repeat protein